jgi:signal transduction histidine kinase
MISRANDQLALVDNILHATALEAEKINVGIHEFVLGDFLNQLKSAYDILEKKLPIRWECAEPLARIKTDSVKLKHILQNLIGNALKFTKEGSVTVSAKLIESSKQQAEGSRQEGEGLPTASRLLPPGYVEFKVADTGVGIPKEQLPLIFERFHQVDSSETRLFGGVGMGLYIVKQFTELLGGTAKAESEVGKGSTFTVTIPCTNQ